MTFPDAGRERALRNFFRIAEARGLQEQQQMRLLELESRSTLQSWKRDCVATIPKDALDRSSYDMGIYKGLQVLLSQDRRSVGAEAQYRQDI
jgi:hypothetical protein